MLPGMALNHNANEVLLHGSLDKKYVVQLLSLPTYLQTTMLIVLVINVPSKFIIGLLWLIYLTQLIGTFLLFLSQQHDQPWRLC
jgi:hypothetical protein